ncbi:28S ribosomal protein S28, mitochondrial [Araneus ventricosus]|uniref:28S ribosomal protein S28, mitochondrial n=1 Tax=Araneus ventricosus TaxID=182803 RepID=A0A4Y2HMU6_ARAVE|nr:28S ribosomal protein S28, mitochondrial [Araneus ventricosus]
MFRLIRNFNFLRTVNSSNAYAVQVRCASDSSKDTQTDHPSKKVEISISGLAQALGKFRELEKSEGKVESPPKPQRSFLNLLRHSEFVQMGEPRGKVVVGKIFQVVKTDLYIDFGGKFYCVCRKPKRNSELYVRNAEVKVRINELELCARFLGAVEDLTLLEASATLLELVSTPVSSDEASRLNKNN